MSQKAHLIAGASLFVFVAAVVFVPGTAADQPAALSPNFEPAQTNPVRLSPDGTRLFAVNTDNNSLSVFDVSQPRSPALIGEIPVGVGPVSVNARNNDEAWVVNQVSGSVSVVSVAKGIVSDTIHTGPGTEPMDVVFAGTDQAYVSCSRSNAVGVFDTNTHASISTVPVFGGSPRALAVSADGSTVYVAFAISGNATTIVPAGLAPPQPPPTNPKLPLPPKVALIVSANDPQWKSYVTFKMPDNDVARITTGSSPVVSGYYSGVGTVNLGLAVNPVTGDLFVTNTNALNLTFFEPSLRGHWVDNRVTRIQIAGGQVVPFNLNPNIDYKILPNPAAIETALAQPTAVVFDPAGNFMYVAAFGTDRVARVDTNGRVSAFVEVSGAGGSGAKADPRHKRGPRGLALNASAQTLYSLNRISNTISTIDTSRMAVSGETAVGTDRTPQPIKQGRGFLYDAKLSGNGTGACASCHVDADMDHLAWNLGDRGGNMTFVTQNGSKIAFHPMKGPMATLTLRGLNGLSPFHWRGDFIDFLRFNGVFDSLMGSTKLSVLDMNTYNVFINSVLLLPNPNENLDRSLPVVIAGGSPAAGQTDFLTVRGTAPGRTCNSCHTSNPGPGTSRQILGNFTPQPLKIPELRNAYQKLLYARRNSTSIDGFGLAHDGTFSTAGDMLALHVFDGYTNQQKTDMISYVLCFDTGTAPAVGYTITLTAANVKGSQEQSDWATLQSQAAAANIDLMARGTTHGQIHGLLYQPSKNDYISDTNQEYTQAQLQALIENGDTLSFTGAYPGSGTTH